MVVASEATLINEGIISCASSRFEISGTFLNYGTVWSNYWGYYQGVIMNAGSVIKNYGNIYSTNATTTYALITKIGGSLYLYPGSRLGVANGKSPINCTLNTADSQNIYNFHCITNCNGSTYGLLINFGGGYPALDQVGGLLYENTNY